MKIKFCPMMVASAVGVTVGIIFAGIWRAKKIQGLRNHASYLTDQFQLLNHWLEIKNEGKSAASYFMDMGYRHVAIYGMAELANRLSEDLEGSGISVDYGIDRDVCCSIGRIENVFSPDEEFPETEVVVVTPYHSFETIKKLLDKKIKCPVISIEDVIWSV